MFGPVACGYGIRRHPSGADLVAIRLSGGFGASIDAGFHSPLAIRLSGGFGLSGRPFGRLIYNRLAVAPHFIAAWRDRAKKKAP